MRAARVVRPTNEWSRGEPRSLVGAARTMYEDGMTRQQVMEEIYGVDLPREALLFQRDFVTYRKPIGAVWNVHPWELMVPLEEGGPKLAIGPLIAEDEELAYKQAPEVVLLGQLHYRGAPLGLSVFGYHLGELRAGRSTVVGLQGQVGVPAVGASFVVFGTSLIDVFVRTIRRYYAGFAHIDTAEAAERRRATELELASVEALRDEL